jgi:hypothetical protein
MNLPKTKDLNTGYLQAHYNILEEKIQIWKREAHLVNIMKYVKWDGGYGLDSSGSG